MNKFNYTVMLAVLETDKPIDIATLFSMAIQCRYSNLPAKEYLYIKKLIIKKCRKLKHKNNLKFKALTTKYGWCDLSNN